jgi:hypothetical protein
MLCAGFVDVSREEVDSLSGGGSLYPISVGTLSEVIPSVRKLHRVFRCAIVGLCTVSSRPCFDYVNVVWSRRINSCNTYLTSASRPPFS